MIVHFMLYDNDNFRKLHVAINTNIDRILTYITLVEREINERVREIQIKYYYIIFKLRIMENKKLCT